jgi:DNA-binding transcriptional MerR regulator
MNQQLYSIADAARLLGGVQAYRIEYLHRTGKVPSPTIIAGRRLYGWDDLERLAQAFHVELKEEEPCT